MSKSRGVLYFLWNNHAGDERSVPTECYAELEISIAFARRQELPVALIVDDVMDLESINQGLFDFIIPKDFRSLCARAKQGNGSFRKTLALELSPFDETLCLDTDCIINDGSLPLHRTFPPQPAPPDIEFAFKKANKHGICMSYGGYVMGQVNFLRHKLSGENRPGIAYPNFAQKAAEWLPGVDYLPLYNSGVVFFNKHHTGARNVYFLAKAIALKDGCDDQVAMSVAFELLDFPVFTLHEKVWNCRELKEQSLPWPRVTISHHRYWREHFKKAKLTA